MGNTPITYHERPELNRPLLLAAWPGLGLVGLKSVQYLQQHYPATLIATIEARDFFKISTVAVKGGILTPPELPSSSFFHIHLPQSTRDLLIFVGDDQPAPGREFAFANIVVDVAQSFGVEHIYTAAAMVTNVNHTEPSRVWAAGTTRDILDTLPANGYMELEEGQIGGLNGLLLGVANLREIEGCCLLGEIPYYVTNLENPKASAVILATVATILDVELDLGPIERKALFVEQQIDQAVRQVNASVRLTGSTATKKDDEEGQSEGTSDEDESHGPIN